MTLLDEDSEEVLRKRISASAEIKRLKTIVAQCDEIIAAVIERGDEDEFTKWVKEVRGVEDEPGSRRIRWQYGNDAYVIYKRAGSTPRKTISAEKLLQHNVPAHVIQECTVEGKPGKGGIGIRKLGSTDEED